jgi:predicted nucleic acid-binding protein
VGTIAVAAGAVVYVDANALIYAVEKVEPFASLLRPVWEAGRSKSARLIGSELLIIETLTGPLKRGDLALADAFDRILHASDLELLPISSVVLREGAKLRVDHGLKTPDAIHAATALRAGCSMDLTNDTGFRRVPGLAATILGDYLTP